MGLRRTPPPGMDATPSRHVDFPTEFPTEYPEFPAEAPPSSPPPPPPPPPLQLLPLSSLPPTPIAAKSPSPKPLSPMFASPKLPSPEQPRLRPPSPIRPQFTPRNSIFPSSDSENLTPHTGLINLARVVNRPPMTPQRPTTSGGAASNRRSIRRTPGAGRLNPLSAKLTARSPHANRAFETRRVERRKSGRYPTARETPRDLLRALSRRMSYLCLFAFVFWTQSCCLFSSSPHQPH